MIFWCAYLTGCAFLTGARSSNRFYFLTAKGFVSRASYYYKNIEKLEQIEDNEELALNELVVYDE